MENRTRAPGESVRLDILNGWTYQQQPCAHWSWLVESRQMEFASTARVRRCRKCCKLEKEEKKRHEENTRQLWSWLSKNNQTKQIYQQFSTETKSAWINYCLSLLRGGKKRAKSKHLIQCNLVRKWELAHTMSLEWHRGTDLQMQRD